MSKRCICHRDHTKKSWKCRQSSNIWSILSSKPINWGRLNTVMANRYSRSALIIARATWGYIREIRKLTLMVNYLQLVAINNPQVSETSKMALISKLCSNPTRIKIIKMTTNKTWDNLFKAPVNLLREKLRSSAEVDDQGVLRSMCKDQTISRSCEPKDSKKKTNKLSVPKWNPS